MNGQNNLEFKLLMKNIKKNSNIIEKRNKTRQEFRKRKEERNKKFEEVFKRNELNEKNRKNELYKRQMSRDLKNIQKRYQILIPEYDEDDLYYNNKNIKNKNIGNKINVYSNKRRQLLNNIKNNFYEKNKNLKIDENNNINDNLNKVNNEIKIIEKQNNNNKNNNKNNTIEKIKNKYINKNKNDMIKNKDININNNVNLNNYPGNKKNNINQYYEISGKKYQFQVIDKKLNEKNVNNICLDGGFFEVFPDINKNKNQIKKMKSLNNKIK